jgi:hypothetical protein
MATARKRALPDFLIIGAIKGGTTFLRTLLSEHPQIRMPAGEIDYFNREYNYKRGELWYRSHFPLRNKVAVGELVGEKTPTYLFSIDAAERIQKDLPNVKLICLLRNPTDRAISHYFMEVRKGDRSNTEALLDERRVYKKGGLYLDQLKRYETYLKKNQLLILSSEEFFANPEKILKQVFNFLGVGETFQCSDTRPRNVGKNKTPISSEVYEHLNEYFKPHNRRLYNYLHRDFGW